MTEQLLHKLLNQKFFQMNRKNKKIIKLLVKLSQGVGMTPLFNNLSLYLYKKQ